MLHPSGTRYAKCQYCHYSFWHRAALPPASCPQCMSLLLLARQGYGWEDLIVKHKIDRALAKAIIFGPEKARKIA